MAKFKLRYILGLYTVLLTLSLHYSTQQVEHILAGFHEKTLQRSLQEPQQSQCPANIVHWSMSDAAKTALESELTRLRWNDKDSIVETKIFIQEAKDILAPYIANDNNLRMILSFLLSDDWHASTSIDAIVFENLPVDPYVPPTPTDESVRSLQKPTFVAEAILLAIGELAGTYTVGYKAETEYSNPWAHEGFPRPGPGGSALTSTAGTLNYHQDMSYHGVIPDLLGLVCLREGDDLELQTTLVSVEKIIKLLPKQVVATLREDRFKITASTQWVNVGVMGEDVARTRAILYGTSLHLPVHWENMVGVDAEASQAIESLRKVLKGAGPSGIHLREGEMVLFNNQKVVHGRTPYQNLKYDGSDRVLIRAYFVKNLDEEQKDSRLL
eukprot:CAMPEP_0172403692 /NCGR_PEP_ID=MMETSP1061-20121228/60439_1 /TAXON_ID=37318 /ORGANISM="Pseudo-nitzschia pungens, Strain cf. pungens" /LENGTH=383 /DNA_ID=CAMNT_0013138207 /DNA_START=188 /DNA_END=1339 /DNA_ORIENTATION=+